MTPVSAIAFALLLATAASVAVGGLKLATCRDRDPRLGIACERCCDVADRCLLVAVLGSIGLGLMLCIAVWRLGA